LWGSERRTIGLGGAVDLARRLGRGELQAANEVMARCELDGAKCSGNGDSG
jgi:hypothetical protein